MVTCLELGKYHWGHILQRGPSLMQFYTSQFKLNAVLYAAMKEAEMKVMCYSSLLRSVIPAVGTALNQGLFAQGILKGGWGNLCANHVIS